MDSLPNRAHNTGAESPGVPHSGIRAAALDGVLIAADAHRATERTLRYYLRSALSHGVPFDAVCTAAQLDAATVEHLTDPAVE